MTQLDLSFRETYPHPIEKVWEALSTSAGLAAWLMRNDFELRLGHECTFRFCPPGEGDRDRLVYVRVLAIEAPYRMVWSWRNENEPEASKVTFRLREVPAGTELILEHSGPASDRTARELRKGWPAKFAALHVHLDANSDG